MKPRKEGETKMNDIGKKMFDRRKELGLTLEEVGEAVGVGKSTVRKWENGMIRNMGSDKIAKLAEVLKMNPVEFVPGDGEIDYNEELKKRTDQLQTIEARIISGGIDRMPPEKREQAIKVLQAIFAEYFDGGEKHET